MSWLGSPVHFLKRLVRRQPRLYGLVYSAATFNVARLRELPARRHMPSRFGGLWTERDDFEVLLEGKLRSGTVRPDELDILRRWHANGYVILRDAIDLAAVDGLTGELDQLPQCHPAGLRITGGGHLESRPYRSELLRPHDSIRIVDWYFHSVRARRALFDPAIERFLRVVLGAEPVLTQSLSFEHGSEQAIHRDTAFVIMNPPLSFAAAWIALEDVREGSGELQYYPGSHRWGDFLFSGRFKHWDRERDGEAQLQAWYMWMEDQARRRGVRRETFAARKGDVLIWHGGLAHGGAPILDSKLTRRSLVGHYCPRGTRPLYHYYKPAHRRIHEVDGHQFTSSHYLGEPVR